MPNQFLCKIHISYQGDKKYYHKGTSTIFEPDLVKSTLPW